MPPIPTPPDVSLGGANPAQDCDCLATPPLPACLTAIRFLTHFATQDLSVYVEDKWGQWHLASLTTDGDGYASLLVADLPPALFNAYAGYFKLFATKAGDPMTDWIQITINSVDYLCMILHFANFGTEIGIVTL